MKKIIYLLYAVIPLVLLQCTYPHQAETHLDFKERGGVINLFFKLKNQDTVKVAYLGGSITAQPGWRVYSRKWLSEQYPETVVEEINAAIGGTGSPFGVYRLQDHVLRYDPDIVFVEFAVNDASTKPAIITQSMEGIIHQIWQQDPEIDICYIYTIKSGFIETYENDSLPTSVATMERIADHYEIPSINFGPEVIRRVNTGKLLFKGDEAARDNIAVFSPDNVHPYADSGHKIYHEVFVKAFNTMKENPKEELQVHKIKPPLSSNPQIRVQMINWGNFNIAGDLTTIETKDHPRFNGFNRFLESLGEGLPGDSILFNFSGTAFGLYDIIGPGSGNIIVSVDEEETPFKRFDKHCTYWRMSYKTIDHLPDTAHKVIVRVSDESIDKKKILASSQNRMRNVAAFEDKNWYLAKILLEGDLVLD